jgi:hypothetical protein
MRFEPGLICVNNSTIKHDYKLDIQRLGEITMSKVRQNLALISVLLFAALGAAIAEPVASPAGSALEAHAQAEQKIEADKPLSWTRSHWEAVKKHWAEDRVRFDNCSTELHEAKAKKRMSPRRQVRFMEKCTKHP